MYFIFYYNKYNLSRVELTERMSNREWANFVNWCLIVNLPMCLIVVRQGATSITHKYIYIYTFHNLRRIDGFATARHQTHASNSTCDIDIHLSMINWINNNNNNKLTCDETSAFDAEPSIVSNSLFWSTHSSPANRSPCHFWSFL